jgi:hypothetical protein
MKIGKGRIVFDQDDWLAGLNLQYTAGLTDVPAPEVGNGLSTATRFNPFRYLGYASPGFDPTDVTGVSAVDAVLKNIALSSEVTSAGPPVVRTSYAYLISGGQKIFRLELGTKTLSTGSWPYTIVDGKATAAEGLDIVPYTSNITNAATPCVFYTWNDTGGAWNVGRFRTDTSDFTDNFITAANFSSTGNNKPHPLVVGADDVLYIGDGNVLQAYDGATGADGTNSTAVLTLPQGYIITSFARISQPVPYLVLFAYYSPVGNSVSADVTTGGPAKAFFYDYLSLDPTYIIDLNDRTVAGGFVWKGTIGCFTEGDNLVNDGANRFSRLKIWNGSLFETAVTYIGNIPTNGGVDVVGDSIQWNTDGIFHSYGAPFEGLKVGLNKLGVGGGITNGVLRTVGGTTGFQLASTGTTTAGGLQYMKVGTFAGNASVGSIVSAPEFSSGMKGKVRSVRIDFAKTSGSTGASINAYLVTDNGTSSQILSGVALVDSSNLSTWYLRDINGATLPLFYELRVLLTWSGGAVDTDAPVVRRVIVDFEETNISGT